MRETSCPTVSAAVERPPWGSATGTAPAGRSYIGARLHPASSVVPASRMRIDFFMFSFPAAARGQREALLRRDRAACRSEEHTSELQSLMRISYAVFCLKKKTEKVLNDKYTSSYHQPHKRHIRKYTLTQVEHES